MSTAPRYETVGAASPASPTSAGSSPSPFNKGVVVKMVTALAIVVGAYVTFTLTSESKAVNSAATPSFQSYLPSEPPSAAELSLRSVVQQALQAAPADAFNMLAHGEPATMSREDFDAVLSGALHATISEAVAAMPPPSGPFAPFFTTVRAKSQLVTVSAPTLLDRVFAVVDTDHDGAVTHAEFQAAVVAYGSPSPAAAFAVLDADSDGFVTSEEIDPVVVDAVNATLYLFHQAVDVFSAGLEEVSPVVSTLAVASMSPAFTFPKLWTMIVSMPQFDTRIAPAVAMSFDSPQLSDEFFAHARADLEETRTRFEAAVGESEGLDSDAFIAFAAQKYVEDWATNENVLVGLRQVQQALATSTAGMGPAGAMLAAPAAAAPAAPAAAGEAGEADAVPDLTVSAPSAELLRAAQAEFNKHPDRLFWPLFQLLDLDRNGVVTVEEFSKYQAIASVFMRPLEPVEAVDRIRAIAQAVFDFVDGSGDGEITTRELQDFIDAATVVARESTHVLVDVLDIAVVPRAVHMASSALIAILDTDQDGKVALSDIMTFAASLSAMASGNAEN